MSERESELRRRYRCRFCPAVNNPLSPQYQKSVRKQDPVTGIPVGALEILEDDTFPVVDVAKAIKAVVRGEEDRDERLYREGASALVEMDRLFEPRAALYLSLRTHHGGDDDKANAQQGLVLSADAESPMPELRFTTTSGGVSREGLRAVDELTRVSEDDPELERALATLRQAVASFPTSKCEIDSSFILFASFMDYLRDYHRFFQLGVCHWKMCGRIYVKTKGKPHMRYCSQRCAERDRYDKSKLTEQSV